MDNVAVVQVQQAGSYLRQDPGPPATAAEQLWTLHIPSQS